MSGEDRIVRGITNDGSFRVITARTTDTVRGVLAAQKPKTATGALLGQVVTGAVLVRETMAPQLRVQVIVKGAGGQGSLVADAHPDGLTRGLAHEPKDGSKLELGEGALLQALRTMPGGELHQGIVTAKDGGISGALMRYMQESEQVTTMIATSCVFKGDELQAAGGYCVQLLPEVDRSSLEHMIARLESFQALDKTVETSLGDADAILAAILNGIEHTRLDDNPIHFGCVCDEVRVLSALATLGPEDIEHLLKSEEKIELTCDYCNTGYQVPHAQLRALSAAS